MQPESTGGEINQAFSFWGATYNKIDIQPEIDVARISLSLRTDSTNARVEETVGALC